MQNVRIVSMILLPTVRKPLTFNVDRIEEPFQTCAYCPVSGYIGFSSSILPGKMIAVKGRDVCVCCLTFISEIRQPLDWSGSSGTVGPWPLRLLARMISLQAMPAFESEWTHVSAAPSRRKSLYTRPHRPASEEPAGGLFVPGR